MQDRVLEALYKRYYHTVHAKRGPDGTIQHISGFGRFRPDPHLVEAYREAIAGGFEAFKSRVAGQVKPRTSRPEEGA